MFFIVDSNLFESNKMNTFKKHPSNEYHKHKIKTNKKEGNLGSIYDRQGANFLNVWELLQINNKKDQWPDGNVKKAHSKFTEKNTYNKL